MQYFTHDTSACFDDKVMCLRIDCGGAAVDAYWCVVERMYRDERPFDRDASGAPFKSMARMLGVGAEELGAWLDAMVGVGLLEQDGTLLSSRRVADALAEYQERVEVASKCGKASAAARKRSKAKAAPESRQADEGERRPVEQAGEKAESPVEQGQLEIASPVQQGDAKDGRPVQLREGEEKKREERKDPTESVGSSAPAHAGPALVLLDPAPEARRAAPPRYDPPTPAEVAEFVAASGGYPIDGEAFCGWYSDHGWPPNGWHGSAMRWSREERDRAARSPREVSADDLAYLDGGAVAV